MSKFFGGWNDFQNKDGYPISNIISYCSLGTTLGQLTKNNVFNNPTGGTWSSNTVGISSSPTVIATDGSTLSYQASQAATLNNKTQTINSNAPNDLNNLIFCYGNEGCNLDFIMQIPLNLGVTNFNKVQLSYLTNSVVKGDSNNNVEVFDFGSGPYTGNLNLNISFNNFFGPTRLGLFLNDTSGNSSIYNIDCIVLPVSNDLFSNLNSKINIIYNNSYPIGPVKIPHNQPGSEQEKFWCPGFLSWIIAEGLEELVKAVIYMSAKGDCTKYPEHSTINCGKDTFSCQVRFC